MYSLKGKVVVITGGSSGIGKALVIDALRRGGKVAACARNIEKLKDVFTDNDNLFLLNTDVSKEEDCKAFIDAVVAKWGGVDVLINNAGISMRALFEEVDLRVLREMMDVNFWGAVYCTKYVMPTVMLRHGVIAAVSSIAGYRGLPGRTGYCASKFAMQGFFEALRTELLHTNVHVMWICPGFTASNIRNVARNKAGAAQGETPLDENKLMSAEECARLTLNAVEQRKRSLLITGQGKLTVLVNKIFPKLADKLIYRHFLNERDSLLRKYES